MQTILAPLLVDPALMLLFFSEVIYCSFFLFFAIHVLYTLISFGFSPAAIPYSAVAAAPGKQAVLATSSFGTTLSGLSNESLVTELQTALRKSQDIAAVLADRAS